MSKEIRFEKNKKVVALSISLVAVIVLAGVFGTLYILTVGKNEELTGDYDELLIDFNKLNETHFTLTQIETLCSADTYVNEMEPDTNFGNDQYWYAGEDEYTYTEYMAFFNFSLLDKPETYEKVEIYLVLGIYSEGICYPFKFFQDWDENTLTYNNRPSIDFDFLSFAIYYDLLTGFMNMNIDVTDWVNSDVDSISIVVCLGDYYTGYSREHPNQDLVPKLVWTIIEGSA